MASGFSSPMAAELLFSFRSLPSRFLIPFFIFLIFFLEETFFGTFYFTFFPSDMQGKARAQQGQGTVVGVLFLFVTFRLN